MARPGMIVVLLAFGLSACATLDTRPYRERTDTNGGALHGVSYSLPMLQYDLTVSRTLVECPGGVVGDKPTSLKFDVSVAAKERFVPGEAYSVDYEALSGFFKTSSFEIAYHPNGTLKSIGATAEDKTDDFAKNVAKVALAGMSIAAGAPAVGGAVATTMAIDLAGDDKSKQMTAALTSNLARTQAVVCTDAARELVTALAKTVDDKKQQTEALRKANREVANMRDRAVLKLVARKDRDRMLELLEAQDEIADRLLALDEHHKELLKKLTVVEPMRWPERFTERVDVAASKKLGGKPLTALSELVKLDSLPGRKGGPLLPGMLAPLEERARQDKSLSPAQREAVTKRLRALALSETGLGDDPAACTGPDSAVGTCLQHHVGLDLVVARDWPTLADCEKSDDKVECVTPIKAGAGADRYRDGRDAKVDSGLFVREPVRGRLLVCRAGAVCSEAADEAKLDPALFPQMGQLRFLPFSTGVFQAKDMSVSLAEDGRIEKFHMKSTKAPAQAVSASAADIATQIDTAFEKRETERRDDLKYLQGEETAALEAEVARLTAEANLTKLRAPAGPPDPLKPVRDETVAIYAEAELLRARLERQLLADAVGGSSELARAVLDAIGDRND